MTPTVLAAPDAAGGSASLQSFGGLQAIRLAQAAHEAEPDDSTSEYDEPLPIAANGETRRWPSPTLTLLKSMLVPGWGQLTNRKYVKAVVVIGLETWFLTGAISSWRQAQDALERFRTRNDLSDNSDFFDYQYYWGNRSDFLWALGLTVFISMFDAYVDAHLRPYEEDTIPGVIPPAGVEITLLSF
jgi:hypothetical protein